MRRTVPLVMLLALFACGGAPDLEPTEGGYTPGMAPAAADTGAIAPHDGPAPHGAAPAGTGGTPADTAGIETSPGAAGAEPAATGEAH